MLSKLCRIAIGAAAGSLYLGLATPLVRSQSLTNASFESPVVTAYTDAIRPTGATWAFTGQSGIRNNSAPNGTVGKQAAFLSAAPVSGNNNFGSFRQTVTFKPGTYYVRYLAAVKTPSGRPQPLQFYVNGAIQGGVLNPRNLTDTNTGGFEAGWTLPFIVTTTGSYELRFDATNATNYGTVSAPLMQRPISMRSPLSASQAPLPIQALKPPAPGRSPAAPRRWRPPMRPKVPRCSRSPQPQRQRRRYRFQVAAIAFH